MVAPARFITRGPTETTIVNTMQDYKPWRERLTIGAPTPNNTVYVLDENLQPCAIGGSVKCGRVAIVFRPVTLATMI